MEITSKSGTTRVPAHRCLNCGELHTAHSHLDGRSVPRPGDFSLCINCGAVHAIADDLTLRRLTDDEIEIIDSDREIQRELVRIKRSIDYIRQIQ